MTNVSKDGRVSFRFFRREASQVRVAGDFNGWKGDRLVMKPQGDGWWTAETALPHGDYRFRYWVDGDWFTDYAAHGIEYSPIGINSMLVVPKTTRRKVTAAAVAAA
jgi:1,4-alpha-glucan branching enzyme